MFPSMKKENIFDNIFIIDVKGFPGWKRNNQYTSSRMKSVKDKGSITWIIIDVKGDQQWQRKINNKVDDKGKSVTRSMTGERSTKQAVEDP